jgi:tetratricopeptide (TPR) repeat protein
MKAIVLTLAMSGLASYAAAQSEPGATTAPRVVVEAPDTPQEEARQSARKAAQESRRAERASRREPTADRPKPPRVTVLRRRIPDMEYARAIAELNRGRYEEAAQRFRMLAERAADEAAREWRRHDAAVYWQAYAEYRLGRSDEAISTLSSFSGPLAESQWCKDARALEIEIRQSAGKPVVVEAVRDVELKLLALQREARRGRVEAVPAVEEIVFEVNPPGVKERALFVLAQTATPRARQALAKIARGGPNPELQVSALRYLTLVEDTLDRELLKGVYIGAVDLEVKRAIVESLRQAKDVKVLTALARREKDAEARRLIARAISDVK